MSEYWRLICLSVSLVVTAPLLAAEADPPGRVGRISLAHEGTQVRIGDSSATGTAVLNWPLTTGALIETASGARTEARIGSTTLQIDGGTSLEFLELSDERIWLRLGRGSVVLGIQNPAHAAEAALDTPQGRLRFDAPGTYRADVAGGTTGFSAYGGAAHIEDLGLTVRAGERILLLGGADRNYLLGQAMIDAFRQWSLAREQLDNRSGNRYLSPEMTGHEELDRSGSWRETYEYGPAWFPQGLPVGWAPYRWGRWAWVPPWGWTWVDNAPWGFAPFHYGRWELIGGNWAWLPGAYEVRPIFAPALVVWLGQPGWNASFSFGSAPAVGWFPLGPREIYYPTYRSSLRHVRNINAAQVPNAQRITSVSPPTGGDRHIHRGRSEAVTIVPEKTVASGTPIDRTALANPEKGGQHALPIASPPQYSAPLRDKFERDTRPSPQTRTESFSAGKPPVTAQPSEGIRSGGQPGSTSPASINQPAPPMRREVAAPLPTTPAVNRSEKTPTMLESPAPQPYKATADQSRPSSSQSAAPHGPSQPPTMAAPTPQRPTSGTANTGPEKSREAGNRDQTKVKQIYQEH